MKRAAPDDSGDEVIVAKRQAVDAEAEKDEGGDRQKAVEEKVGGEIAAEEAAPAASDEKEEEKEEDKKNGEEGEGRDEEKAGDFDASSKTPKPSFGNGADKTITGFGSSFGGFGASAVGSASATPAGGFFGFSSAASSNPFASFASSQGGSGWGSTAAAATSSEEPHTTTLAASDAASAEAKRKEKEEVVRLLDSTDVVNGEEGEVCVLQLRAKAYRLDFEDSAESESNADIDEPTAAAAAESTREEEEKDVEEGAEVAPKAKGGDGNEIAQKRGDDAALPTATSSVQKQPRQEWKEVGIGPVRVLREKDGSARRIVMRRENHPGGTGTKVLLNAPLKGRTHVSRQSEKALTFTHFDALKALPVTYLIKVKSPSEADSLYHHLHTNAKVEPPVSSQSSMGNDER